MTFLATTPRDTRQREQDLALTATDPQGLEPGLFEGMGSALGTGSLRALGSVSALAGTLEAEAASIFTTPIDDLFGTDTTGFLREELERKPQATLATLRPDPYTTGAAGNVLYSLVGVGLPTVVGAYAGGPWGAALLGGAAQGTGTFSDLRAEGVDSGTAQLAALADAGLTAGGVALPMSIGRNVALNTLAFGPGVNVAQDVIASQVIGETLRANGYAEMADRYQSLDTETLIADAVLGAAFGYYGARGARKPLRPDVGQGKDVPTAVLDAALVAQDVHHAEIDLAPGIPTSDTARRAHVETLAQAERDLLDGKPVRADVPEDGYLPRDVTPDPLGVVADAMHRAGYPELAAEVKALEAELVARGRVNPDAPLVDLPRPIPDPARPVMTETGPRPAHEAMGEAEAHVARAQREAGPAFEAAIACFLRTGV